MGTRHPRLHSSGASRAGGKRIPSRDTHTAGCPAGRGRCWGCPRGSPRLLAVHGRGGGSEPGSAPPPPGSASPPLRSVLERRSLPEGSRHLLRCGVAPRCAPGGRVREGERERGRESSRPAARAREVTAAPAAGGKPPPLLPDLG